MFNNYSPKAKLKLVNIPRGECSSTDLKVSLLYLAQFSRQFSQNSISFILLISSSETSTKRKAAILKISGIEKKTNRCPPSRRSGTAPVLSWR